MNPAASDIASGLNSELGPRFTAARDRQGTVPLSRRVPPSALSALLRLSASRLLRGRRLLILGLMFSLPVVFAVLARRFQEPYRAAETETILIFGLIPQALLPLAALLFATGMVQDEVEEQTLTYLLMRPIPRWLIYLTKLTATWVVTSVAAILFTATALVVVHWGAGGYSAGELARRTAIFGGLLSLSLLTYTALFGALSLVLRRSLVLGVAYIVIFEGVVANIDFAVRHLTIMYYVRTLSVRWLGLTGGEWAIHPETAPGAAECLICLAVAAAVLALLGACVFSLREFRVKTPEGS